MASNLLKFHVQSCRTPNPSIEFLQRKTLFPYLPFPKIQHQSSTFFTFRDQFQHRRIPSLSVHSSLSFSAPPSSKEEAILQAKTCLSTTLEKPLNNPKLAGKLKKLKQPRFRVEIPVIDDSPSSLSQLALDVFKDLSIKRKGSRVKILILWSNPTLRDTASQLFQSHSSNNVVHADISSIKNVGDESILDSAEVVVFLGVESSQLQTIKTITESLYPKPAVIFNPKWGYEEESEFGEKGRFLGSFEVIYSFMGLEVRGVLSKRKGVVFKCERNGVVSGEKWEIHVEEEGGKLEVVSRFKERPSIGEVENVLYNLMAINSPITKSAKFLKGLVSNVTGNK